MKAVKTGFIIVLASAVMTSLPVFASDDEASSEAKKEVAEKVVEKTTEKTPKAEKPKSKGKNPFAAYLKNIEKIDKDIEAAQAAEDTKKIETLNKQKGKEQEKLKTDLDKRTASIDKKIENLEKKLEKTKDAKKKAPIQKEIEKLEKKRSDLECLSRGEDPAED